MRWIKRFAVMASAVALLGTGVVVAQAATSATTPQQFSACLNLKTKTLTNVSFSASAKCAPHTTAISWNAKGPAGPRGAAGPKGATGPKGDTGARGVAGPTTLTALQGAPCTFGGSYPSTTAVSIDPITGATSITCTPVTFTLQVTNSLEFFNVVVTASNTATNLGSCGGDSICEISVPAGLNYTVTITATAGTPPFHYTCAGGASNSGLFSATCPQAVMTGDTTASVSA